MHVIHLRNKNRAINAVIIYPNMLGPLLRMFSTFTFHVCYLQTLWNIVVNTFVGLCFSLPVTPRAWRNAWPRGRTLLQPWWRPVWSVAWMCPSRGAWKSVPAKAPPAPFLRWAHCPPPLHRLRARLATDRAASHWKCHICIRFSLRSVVDNVPLCDAALPFVASISATACCWRCWPARCSCRSAA